jgi:hypothetical protein
MALGSQRAGILKLVFASAAKLGIAGCVIGLAGAGAASHLLSSLLFNVSPFDPLVLALAGSFRHAAGVNGGAAAGNASSFY